MKRKKCEQNETGAESEDDMKKDLRNAMIAGTSIAFGITLATCIQGKKASLQKAGVSFLGAFATELILTAFDRKKDGKGGTS